MRIRLSSWRTSLSAALGLATVACGGQSTLDGNEKTEASGGSSSGGSATGGISGEGGTTPTGGSSGSAGSAGGGVDLACTNPEPVRGFDGAVTGFVACDGGFIHRPERTDCASRVPRPEPIFEPGDAGVVECTTDADCAGLPYGHCVVTTMSYPPSTSSRCVAGCVRDDDCSAASICLCSDPVGKCVPATCALDADCGDFLCVSSSVQAPCGGVSPGAFSCQTESDRCRGFDDCARGLLESCITVSGRRECRSQGACGRPFLVGGEARVAALVDENSGWTTALAPNVGGLDGPTRRVLAEHYARLGLMEHASVAAFARFALQLLSIGAPSDLVAACQAALGDEIRHAETCFGLARAYAGHSVGPGPLSAEGGLDGESLERIAELVLDEACIGETLAAVEAAEAAEAASDPVVRRALVAIAEDEKRHAELGWRFVGWALERVSAGARARLAARLDGALAEIHAEALAAPPEPAGANTAALLEHGVLTAELRREARRAALEELVEPLAALLGLESARRAA